MINPINLTKSDGIESYRRTLLCRAKLRCARRHCWQAGQPMQVKSARRATRICFRPERPTRDCSAALWRLPCREEIISPFRPMWTTRQRPNMVRLVAVDTGPVISADIAGSTSSSNAYALILLCQSSVDMIEYGEL